ncbi:MAG: aminopeptidase [Pseudomonadales bacterium]
MYFPYQAAKGQLALVGAAQDIDEVLQDKVTDPLTRSRLELAMRALDFAQEHLALGSRGNYRRYTALNRRYVVWNVFAAPEFSSDLKQYCFPVAGCVSYRGYFNEDDANAVANRMRRKGNDVVVVGVAAYTTLGWFRDPLLDTFVLGSEEGLIRTLFHELAHLRLYVPGDTDWNESYASAVSELGVQAFSVAQPFPLPTLTDQAQWAEKARQTERLILAARTDLTALYSKELSAEVLRTKKAERLARLKADYRDLIGGWPKAPYQRLMTGQVNNASLALVQSYSGLTPRFIELHRVLGGNFEHFHEAVRRLSTFDASRRRDPNLWNNVIAVLDQESTRAGDQ